MKKHLYILLLSVFVQQFHIALAQSNVPAILWQKTIGGNSTDVLSAMCVGANKSIVLCGSSNSNVSGNKTNASFGGNDYWIVKLDSSGTILWNKTYGGSDDDIAAAIIATSDGGYLVGGSSISDKSGSKSAKSFQFSYDYWVLKLDANGNKLWDKTLGGSYAEQLTSLAELPNGNYLVAGYSYSDRNGTKTSTNMASEINADYWITLLNPNGSEVTQHLFGGEGQEVLTCVSPAGASSYYAAGYSYSPKGGGKTLKTFGNNDYYIVRSNLKGKIEFQGDFGGKLSDYLTCMQALPDSSYIVGGYSNSPKSNTKTAGFYGVNDFWLLKLNRDGTKQWDKTISGGAGPHIGGDYLVSIQQTKDKGFILGSYSNAPVGNSKTDNSRGGYDFWIVKTDSLGNVQWDKTIGGSGDDKLTAVYELDANQYIVAGTSASAQSGEKTSGIVGNSNLSDYWILRLGVTQPGVNKLITASPKTAPAENSIYKLELMPNPVKEILTIKCSAAVNDKVDFVIYSEAGRTVLQSSLTTGNKEMLHSFNVANLPAGSYFAVMYAGQMKLTKVFTKE